MLNRRRRAAGEGSSPGPQLTLTMSRKSILPPLKSSFLRRTSEPQLPPAPQKQPLLAVVLSSPSFLDSSIRDEDSDSAQPLYRIKTSGTSTTVLRRDPSKSTVTAASVKWPKMIPLKRGKDSSDGVLLMMKDGRWSGGESLLKPASKDGARKFNIPNYNHTMKWKQYGAQYWCTTPTVQGPIATFEPRKGSQPPKLTVYETLHDKHDPASLSAFRGVSILLLDYLVVTSLLLVTDLQEWMLVRKFEGMPVNLPNSSEFAGQGPSSAPGLPTAAASNPQWRKIAFGEPIFPKIAGDAKSIHGDITSSLPPIQPNRQPPSIMTRSDGSSSSQRSPGFGMRSFIDTDPDSEDDSESEDTHYDISRTGSRSHHRSPTAESIASSTNAPSHAYADPSFYRPPTPLDEPAIPSRPLSGISSITRRHIHSQPSSPLVQSYRYSDDLVPPPLPQAMRRARSVSPASPILEDPDVLTDILNGYHFTPNRHFAPPPVPTPPPPSALRPSRLRSDSIGSSISTTSRRPLPQPPATAQLRPQELRRAQSSNGLLENGQVDHASIRVTPPAPQRTLPYAPHTPRILPSSPRSQATFSDMGPALSSPESYGDSVAATSYAYPHSHAQPSQHTSPQHYLHPYNTDEVHSRQPPITKSSHEDLAQWLHELTTDSQVRDHAPEPLPSSTIYDVPPPAYNSIAFSSRPEGFYQPPVAYSHVGEVYDTGLPR